MSCSPVSVSRDRWRLAVAASLVLAAGTAAQAQTEAQTEGQTDSQSAEPGADTGGSFFESFDGDSLDRDRWYVADGWANSEFHGCAFEAQTVTRRDGRLLLSIERAGESASGSGAETERDFLCAEVQSTKRYGYGAYEARLRSAGAEGVMSAFFTYTGPPFGDPHDEIDVELPGARPETAELNSWVDGSDGGGPHEYGLGFDADDGFRDYGFVWSPEAIRFFVDGELVHTITDPDRIPETPGKIFLTLYNGRGDFEPWLGRFAGRAPLPEMSVAHVAYTAPGDPCPFPGSIACESAR